ncbi:DUF6227 family protein [Streptomyces sp. NPDC048111]|uniref:DUF6227 family protein n=1 Tax=Streptomyces sp. NPDC048111 TaxID=3365500 RepID=UPI00370F7DEA
MLHVPHPLDGERGPGDESAQDQLAALLGRALNSFDLPDELVERLALAMAHTTSLHSSLHTSAAGTGGRRLSRETYRHCYLLLDGTTVTLWELAHHDGREYAHELYAAEDEARLAAARLHRGTLPAGPPAGPDDELDALVAELNGIGLASGVIGAYPAVGGFDGVEDCWEAGLGPEEVIGADRAAASPARPRAPYAPDDSADHARRLLRRAENPDRPGGRTALRLRGAHAHRITQAFGRHCRTGGREAAFTLYEHAFLLLDGGELSLWEVEHTATPDGRHMCEVYGSEQAARTAMERRAHVG